MEKKREDLTPAEEIAALVALTNPKDQAALVNPHPGMSMNSMPFRIFRNVKKNKRAAAKRRNVLRARARQK
jgi:hypothetical protein